MEKTRELGNPRYEAAVLQFIGIGYGEVGDVETSSRYLTDSLAISRHYQDRYTETLSMLALARLHLNQKDPRARATAETSLALGRTYQMPHHVADALALLGEIELADGQRGQAASYFEESVRLWRTRGWPLYLAAALRHLGNATWEVDPSAARAAWLEAREIYDKLGDAAKADELSARLAALA